MYLGLVDASGVEVTGRGYCRVYLGGINFRISPPEDEDHTLTFVNNDAVEWRAGSRWLAAGLGVYEEADSEGPAFITMFPVTKVVLPGETILVGRGQIRVSTQITVEKVRG